MGNKPPLCRATKIPRTDAGYGVTDGNIAAIDFGTTSVSLAYTTKGDKKIRTLPLDTEAKFPRVLNVILLKKDENEMEETMTVVAFGGDARKRFTQLRAADYKNYVYFERIKMLMKREEVVTRETLVESFSGERYYLVEVIAFILRYLKDQLIDHLSRTVKPLKTTDFDWVITVPAIWDARGKRMMREAAYMAGLLTVSEAICNFTSVYGSLPIPAEVNPDKLTLALEPEAAALYSQENVVEDIKGAVSYAAISPPTEYMVIDIGGGTVDITAHAESDGGIVVENIPTGNAWGGTQVNEAFSQLLQNLVRDPGFKRFEASGKYPSKQKAIINSILYDEFEGQKILFGQCKIKDIVVDLPKFAAFYDDELTEEVMQIDGIDYEDDSLYINREIVESKLFGPAVNGILDCTVEAIKGTKHKINTFYLVGGFGGCKYVHDKISAKKDELYDPDVKTHVIVPIAPHLAVAQGAVIWRDNPERIKARRSDATYGIGISMKFDAEKHDKHYKFYNDDDEKDYCNNIFSVFLEKEDLAKADEVYYMELVPLKQSSSNVIINIYSTPTLGVQYTVDKSGKDTVSTIGQLVVDIPNPDNLPKNERVVDITMDFSGTEIQAKAKNRVTGEEVKTVCDFLSAK